MVLFAAMGVVLILAIAIVSDSYDRERAEHDARFLHQCAEAGYDAAHCRFFLTATGRGGNSDAAFQMIIQSATH